MKKNLNIIILGLAALSLSSCKTLYGKYERPDVKTSGIVRDVASDTDTLAVKDTTPSPTSLGAVSLPTLSSSQSLRRD